MGEKWKMVSWCAGSRKVAGTEMGEQRGHSGLVFETIQNVPFISVCQAAVPGRGTDPGAAPGLLPDAQPLPPGPLATCRWRLERLYGVAADRPCASLPPALPWQRSHLPRALPFLPDPGGRPPADRAALYRAQTGARWFGDERPGVAVVECSAAARWPADFGSRSGAAPSRIAGLCQRPANRGGGGGFARVHTSPSAVWRGELDGKDGSGSGIGSEFTPAGTAWENGRRSALAFRLGK
jgi:hypothetical protein